MHRNGAFSPLLGDIKNGCIKGIRVLIYWNFLIIIGIAKVVGSNNPTRFTIILLVEYGIE
jgi:hypothetical protein